MLLRYRSIGLLAVAAAVAGAAQAAAPPIPGASFRICAGNRDPYPQYALAKDGTALWVACPRTSELLRVDSRTGRTKHFRTRSVSAYSIAAGGGAVWIADRGPILYRVATKTGAVEPLNVGARFAYLWFAAGSVWAADDAASTLLRIDPRTRKVVARIPTGNGTSALVTDGRRAWIANHREGTIQRIDLATNRIEPLAKVAGDAPERMVLAFGSLWITGRGTDLARFDPETGALQATIDVREGAIDLVATRTAIWVPAPTAANDRQGLPIAERLLKIDPATNRIVDVVYPTVVVAIDGVTVLNGRPWFADVANGRLLRLDRT